MKGYNAPCYKCEERQLGCHSSCDRYADYKVGLSNKKHDEDLLNPRKEKYKPIPRRKRKDN